MESSSVVFPERTAETYGWVPSVKTYGWVPSAKTCRRVPGLSVHPKQGWLPSSSVFTRNRGERISMCGRPKQRFHLCRRISTRNRGVWGSVTSARTNVSRSLSTRNKGLFGVPTRNGGVNEIIHARGHENVTAQHASTLELTSDDFLTPAGDCILGIEADRVPAGFNESFVAACQSADTTIIARLQAGGYTDSVRGRGDPELTFASERSLVCRTSEYVDDRTVAVGMDAAAGNIDRNLVDALADGADLTVTLTVE